MSRLFRFTSYVSGFRTYTLPALKRWELIWILAKRDVVGRYKGSYLGLLWSLIIPLLMLAIYTFVFGVIFKSRWTQAGTSTTRPEFALILFCGLTTFGVFSEIVNKAPTLLIENSNYVKKVVFPLAILPLVTAVSALINSGISFVIIVAGEMVILHHIPVTLLLLPVLLFPLVLISIGISWILSALGVYLRDIGYFVSVLVMALMYVTPIFYSISAIPKKFRTLLNLNPVGQIVSDVRDVVLFGVFPGWRLIGEEVLAGLFVASLGLFIFKKLRSGFADVL